MKMDKNELIYQVCKSYLENFAPEELIILELNNHRLKDGGFKPSAESTDTGQIRPVF
jgi:hypothetical protein